MDEVYDIALHHARFAPTRPVCPKVGPICGRSGGSDRRSGLIHHAGQVCPRPSEAIVEVPPVALEVYPLSEVLIPRQASAFGRVRPLDRIEQSAEVAGPVVWRADLDNGDSVLDGQPLLRIDPAPFEARLAAAKAAVQSAEAAVGDLEEESQGLRDRRPGLASQLEAVTREADRLRRAVDSGAVGSSARSTKPKPPDFRPKMPSPSLILPCGVSRPAVPCSALKRPLHSLPKPRPKTSATAAKSLRPLMANLTGLRWNLGNGSRQARSLLR